MIEALRGLVQAPAAGAAERLWWLSAALFVILFLLTWIPAIFDARHLDGANVWAKPLKFEISLAIHLATLALACQALAGFRTSGWLTGLSIVSIVCAIFEIAYIALQAARGERSHFNQTTPLYSALYNAMAAGATVLVITSFIVGLAVLLGGSQSVTKALRFAIGLGFIAGSVLTLVVGLTMGGRLSHSVGANPPGSAHVPLAGWSLVSGDLRAPHFFATHMIQGIPLITLVALRIIPGLAVEAAVAATLLWGGMVIRLFIQALGGRPIWPLF